MYPGIMYKERESFAAVIFFLFLIFSFLMPSHRPFDILLLSEGRNIKSQKWITNSGSSKISMVSSYPFVVRIRLTPSGLVHIWIDSYLVTHNRIRLISRQTLFFYRPCVHTYPFLSHPDTLFTCVWAGE